jgi:hypothetical protein
MISHFKYLSIIVAVIFLNCGKETHNPHLVEYLREERKLRRRINENEGLSDSISLLQQKYNIDIEKEISKLNNSPDRWLELLEELKIEK